MKGLGIMALRKASSFGTDEEALPQTKSSRRNTGPGMFMLKQTPPQNRTTIVVLDDDLVVVCRHKMFVRGDKVAWKLRQTCAGADPEKHPNPVPRICLACEAALHDQRIARDAFYYCTIINEEKFTGRDGRPYADMKQLLELNRASAQVFLAQKQANNGSLKLCRIAVYRSNAQNSARHGDSWTVKGKINPYEHFAKSVGVERILKAAQERGEKIDRKGAIKQLCTPFDYEELMGEYKAEAAEAFVMFLGGHGALAGAGEEAEAAAMPGASTDDADYAVETAKVPATKKKAAAPPPSEDEVEETEEAEAETEEAEAPPKKKKKAPVPSEDEVEETEATDETEEVETEAEEAEETEEVEEAVPAKKKVAGKRPADPVGAKAPKKGAKAADFEDEDAF
jgi:hypothetical protein